MPPDRSPSHYAFDLNLVDPRVLNTPDGHDAALRAVERVCYRGEFEIEAAVSALMSRSHILEYIFSVLDESAYDKLTKWIISGFPTPTTPNMKDTMSMRILQRLSSSLLFAEYPSSAEAPPDLRVFWRKVDLSFNVLKELEEYANAGLYGGNTSPTSRRRSKQAFKSGRIDPLHFGSLGISVPTSDVEVRDVHVEVLTQLQSTLEYYLLVLREPSVSGVFKSSYIKASQASQALSSPTRRKATMSQGQPRASAFPAIQPMKAALYFDDIEGFGEWSILLSTRAQKDLRDYKRADAAMFRIIMKKIKQLSHGHFSSDNQKQLTGPKTRLPVYEAKMTGDTRLVYQIDCMPDLKNSYAAGSQHECQVIRMFGVFTHAQLDHGRFWDSLSRQLQQKGPEYIERCTFRNKPLTTGDNVILPKVFPPLPTPPQETPEAASLIKVREEDMKNIHSMLVLDKFVMLSQALLNSILADKEVAHVFSVSTQEQEIIEHPSSCYVIGRSGTGKTTTMLFKMLAIHRTWKQYRDIGPKPRQVFVTQSRVLAMKVEEYFGKLMWALDAAACTPEELRAMDKDIEQEIDFVDQDDNDQWRSDLPDGFRDLDDEHFPLFITYDRLCTMLQNDIRRDNDNDGFIIPTVHTLEDEATSPTSPVSPWKSRLRAGSRSTSSSDYMQQFRKSFVSYGEFLTSYWDHLPQTYTRVLDPALVFGEFMGVIKGSEDTIGAKHRCLDRESYQSLSVRSQGTFSHKRDDIYDLFMAYTKLKRQRQDYDAADRTHYILKELREVGIPGKKVDFLYVDEVQDNLLIDTLVLRTICTNQHGLFWAGDTAQTISVGSSFRFADLQAYQYRIEKQHAYESGVTPVEPRTFELALNYRSHGGIVNCARSVIELITSYWPYSIDILQPERAIVDGFRPIFFAGQGNADFEKSFFGNARGEAVDFGANQCILVRDDDARNKLQLKLKNSIIMTLYESKGLEFNDVLLYNFFANSTATQNQWRLVLNGVIEGGILSDAPTFDETRHASICVELKFLYVAITRARKNLWIMDSSESAGPMKAYWSSKDQIEVWSSTAEVPRLAVSSTSEEWSKTGRTMFLNKRYAQASVAFLRAGRNREAAICEAYLSREKARSTPTISSADRAQAFITAADAFVACAQECPPKQVNEYLAYYGTAGECYYEARVLKKAGDNYRMAGQYAAAGRTYREGGYFEDLAEVITQHASAIPSGLLERLKKVAQMHYFKRMDVKAARKLFSSEEDALGFLEDYDMGEARAEMLKESGRVLESAEIHANEGDMLKAVETLTAPAVPSEENARPTIEYLLTGLWRGLPFGTLPNPTSVTSELLKFADKLDRDAMTKQEVDELAMFEAIQRNDHASLRVLAKGFIEAKNDPAALLCLDHVFSSPPNFQRLPHVDVHATLSLYLEYIRLLNRFWRDDSLAEGSKHQKLFGFQALGEDRYLVPKHTLVHENLTGQSIASGGSGEEHACTYGELTCGIIELILSRIHDRTELLDNACWGVRGFSPCLRLIVRGECSWGESCEFQHVQQDKLTVEWYHMRIRLLLLHFQILNSARYYRWIVLNYWLGILYSALHPPLHKLGSHAVLNLTKLPEAADGFRVVKEWVWFACDGLLHTSKPPESVYNEHFAPQFMVACTLAFDLDRENARSFVPQTRMYRWNRWPRCLVREGRYFVVRDFVTYANGEAYVALSYGSLFLRQLLLNRLPTDLGHLCDLVERLSGMFIMANKVNLRGLVHNVTLPRSWFINLIRPHLNLGKRTSAMFPFTRTIVDLMRRIYKQVESPPHSDPVDKFRADGGRVTNITGPLYIARICLCLCLMGFNTNDDRYRDAILTSVQSLCQGVEWHFTPSIYRRYVHAKNWGDLEFALADSLKNTLMDEMIVLLHESIPGPHGKRWNHIRPVVYSRLNEVPTLLRADPTTPGIITQQQQQLRVGEEMRSESDGNYDKQEQNVNVPQEKIAEGNEAEEGVDPGSHEQEVDERLIKAAKTIQNAYRCHLERRRATREKAAKRIQAAYLRYLKRKKVVRKGLDATQARYWQLLRKRSTEMEWKKDSRYYLLFRVPLAYIIVCLEAVGGFFELRKKEVKRRLSAEGDEGLEELMEALQQYSGLLKRTIELQKKLAPSSKFHEEKSVSDLQRAVLEAKAVVESLENLPESFGTRSQIGRRWERGYKWIFEKQGRRAKGRKAEKPKLVLDRGDFLYP